MMGASTIIDIVSEFEPSKFVVENDSSPVKRVHHFPEENKEHWHMSKGKLYTVLYVFDTIDVSLLESILLFFLFLLLDTLRKQLQYL